MRSTGLAPWLVTPTMMAVFSFGCSQVLGIASWTDVGLDDASASREAEASDSGAASDAPIAEDAHGVPGEASVDATVPDGRADASPGCGDGGARVDSIYGAFCIDTTEVTSGQYGLFEQAITPQTYTSLPFECDFKNPVDAGLQRPYVTFAGDHLPAVAVDWCDAYAFCAWAGKRLCGERDGGPVASTDIAVAPHDEWYAACSRDGTRALPYPGTFDASACNTGQSSSVAPAEVASHPGCQGGFPGIYDMSGSVLEIENSCIPGDAGPESDLCATRGGAYFFPADVEDDGCKVSVLTRRGDAFGNGNGIGFRCCWDP